MPGAAHTQEPLKCLWRLGTVSLVSVLASGKVGRFPITGPGIVEERLEGAGPGAVATAHTLSSLSHCETESPTSGHTAG